MINRSVPIRQRWAIPWMILLFILTIAPTRALGLAQSAIKLNRDLAVIQFPNSITFHIALVSETEINQIELAYRVEQVTCGEVISRAFPQFTPGTAVATEWTWEMRQSGSLPPGARIYWRWQVTDTAGNTLITQEKYTTWLDDTHDWQTLRAKNLNLHWYNNSEAFAQELLNAASADLDYLEQVTGLKPEKTINIYIYASNEDLRQAILYEPSWVGGQAFSQHDIVIIGIPPGQIDWGKSALAHELTHVLIGHLTFSCLGYLPGWVSEGLAMYGEGGLDDFSQARFEQAILDGTLLSVQALSGGFSENPDKADLSYSQSYSLVNFLIETYGKEPMLAFLAALKHGATVDHALQSAFGFDLEGLENAWRSAIGAQPKQAAAEAETALPLPTPVPTIVPVSGMEVGTTLSPTVVTDTQEPAVATTTETSSPLPATATASTTVLPSPIPTSAIPATTDAMLKVEPSPASPPGDSKTFPRESRGISRIFIYIGAGVLILALSVIAIIFFIIFQSRRMGPPTIPGGS